MIHYFPLAPDEDRWTGFIDRAIVAHLDATGAEYARYAGRPIAMRQASLPSGSFYDPAAVTEHRSYQIADFAAHGFGDGDTLFFTDMFVPGVEAVAYMAHLAGVKLRIRGLIHAGSFTDHDVMNSAERWASMHEDAVLDLSEEVYVGSHWIRTDLVEKRMVQAAKVVVTGFPLDDRLPEAGRDARDLVVVFNGRHSPEKQPWLFARLKDALYGRSFPFGVQYIDTLDERLDKPAYYELLSRAKVVVSFALQETFGTGIQEAVKLGCVPVVPNMCCYPEQFARDYLYDTFDECVERVWGALTGRLTAPEALDCSGAVERWCA